MNGGPSAAVLLRDDDTHRQQPSQRRAQRRHYCPRRSRQNHAGRCHAAPKRHLPGQRAGDGAGDGLQRARTRARHHDSGQEHRRRIRPRQDQHRRHTGARRLRRRGGADTGHGGRRHAAGRRLGRAAAADPLRAEEGARSRATAGRVHQQDRPARCAHRRGAGRDLLAVHRSRCHRGADRVPGGLHQRARRHRDAGPGAAFERSATAVRSHRADTARTAGRRRGLDAVPGQQSPTISTTTTTSAVWPSAGSRTEA